MGRGDQVHFQDFQQRESGLLAQPGLLFGWWLTARPDRRPVGGCRGGCPSPLRNFWIFKYPSMESGTSFSIIWRQIFVPSQKKRKNAVFWNWFGGMDSLAPSPLATQMVCSEGEALLRALKVHTHDRGRGDSSRDIKNWRWGSGGTKPWKLWVLVYLWVKN